MHRQVHEKQKSSKFLLVNLRSPIVLRSSIHTHLDLSFSSNSVGGLCGLVAGYRLSAHLPCSDLGTFFRFSSATHGTNWGFNCQPLDCRELHVFDLVQSYQTAILLVHHSILDAARSPWEKWAFEKHFLKLYIVYQLYQIVLCICS